MIKRCAAILSAFVILFCTASFYYASAATEASTKFSVDVNNAVLELTVPSSSAVIDLNPTMTNASFGSTSINIHVATNNITGYTLTMTPTNDTYDTSLIRTELIGDEEDYREIETLEQTDPISTGYTEETFTANAWGYKITGDNYYGIDPNNTTVSHPAWTTSAPTNGTDHNLTLAAKVDADTVSGAYETTLNFRAITNATIARDIITFDANGGTGSMDGISVPAGDTITLPQNTFTAPEGYRFTGWYAVQTNTTPSKNVGMYTNKAAYTATDTGINRQITLYAEWTNFPCIDNCDDPAPDPTTGAVGTTLQRAYEIAYTAAHKGMWEEINPGSNTYREITDGHYYGEGRDVRFLIQDMTPEICASATALDSEALVLDIRDQKSYWIAKLKDDKCWMTQNLDLDLVHVANDDEALYTHANTDLGWGTDTTTTKWNPERSTIPVSDITAAGSITGWVNDANNPYSVDTGDWYWTDTWYSSAENNYLSGNAGDRFSQTPYVGNGLHGHVGNYYNWAASIASNDSSNYRTDTYSNPANNPQNSICPAGWKLPIRTSFAYSRPGNDDFYNLVYWYSSGINTDRYISASPLRFVRGGMVYSGSLTNSGSGARYWSSTAGSVAYSSNSYFLNYSSDYIDLSYSDRSIGSLIRCVAR